MLRLMGTQIFCKCKYRNFFWIFSYVCMKNSLKIHFLTTLGLNMT